MNALDAELALDRLEARLASELPAHVEGTSRAHLGAVAGVAPIAISDREIALVRSLIASEAWRPRATRLARIILPIVVEADARVARLRAKGRTWDGLRALAAARDAVSQRMFGAPHRVIVHALSGCRPPGLQIQQGRTPVVRFSDTVEPLPGWNAHEAPVVERTFGLLWRFLTRGESFGTLYIARSATAHPRMFAIEPGVRGTIVIPHAIETAAARFAVLHELGHALLWLAPQAREIEWPRAVDEAAASHVARWMEHEDAIPEWFSPLAEAARARRTAIAQRLDRIEDGIARGASIDAELDGIARPPWALWNDPQAQASYLVAEVIADGISADLRGADLVEHLARESCKDAPWFEPLAR